MELNWFTWPLAVMIALLLIFGCIALLLNALKNRRAKHEEKKGDHKHEDKHGRHGKSSWLKSTLKYAVFGLAAVALVVALAIPSNREAVLGWFYGIGGGNTTNPPQERMVVSTACNGLQPSLTLDANHAVEINPGNRCWVNFKVDYGHVIVGDGVQTAVVGPEGGYFGEDFPFVRVQATEGPVVFHYALCPPRQRFNQTANSCV